jgi:DNA polymerase-3 subunit alpha
MAARAAVRDVGRALGYSFSYVDKLARLIPAGFSLEEAEQLGDIEKLIKSDENYRKILNFAKKLEGTIRHASVHACGTVITPGPILDYIPLQLAPGKDKVVITQYDMYSISELGILKMDFLGLRTLSIIETTKNLVFERRKEIINFDQNFDDKDTYKLLNEGNTVGVFQLEGKGITEYLKKIKPNQLEDIVVLLALYRPGPLELIPSYIKRKFNKEEIDYLHPKLEPILKETYGILVYQEQLMKIAQVLANYTPFEADILRKAVGKKIKSLLDEELNKLKSRMINNNIDVQIAEKICQLIEPFARYGFNKSHAVAYAILSYYTAYLKAHYLIEFLVACLIHEGNDIDKVKIYLNDLIKNNIKILPPDINESNFDFTIVNNNTVRFGLGSIKNVGEPLIRYIEEERAKNGFYKNLADFLRRVKHKDLNKKSLESLIKVGVFDKFYDRGTLISNLDYLLEYINKEKHLSSSLSLFGKNQNEIYLKPGKKIDDLEISKWEKELLGIYLTKHPFEKIYPRLKGKIKSIKEVSKMQEGIKVNIAGVLNEIQRKVSKNKKPFAYLEIEDLSGKIEVILFPEVYEKYFEILKEGNIYFCIGTLQKRDNKNIIIGDVLVEIKQK